MVSTPQKAQTKQNLDETHFAPRMKCPHCDNDLDFFEISEEAIIVSHYIQNPDGTFSIEDTSIKSVGGSKLFCGSCEEELSELHQRFSEMIF